MDETFGLPRIEADGMAVPWVVKVARFSGAPNDGFVPYTTTWEISAIWLAKSSGISA